MFANSHKALLKHLLLISSLVIVALALPSEAKAQDGAIEGTVTDAAGEPLPGATVKVTNDNIGLERGTTTDRSGGYRFLSLPTGTYEAEASFVGFQSVIQQNITLRVDQVLRIDFELEDEGVDLDEVVVVGQVDAIEMRATSVSTPVTAAQIQNQPSFSRNILELGKLVPGARSRDGEAANFGGGPSEPGVQSPTGAVFEDFVVDGVSWKDRSAGSTITGDKNDAMLTQEAVDEMRFITNGFGAQYRGGSSVVAINTERGSNTFQGSAFTHGFTKQFRDTGPFESGGIEGDSYRFQWGGSLSGPIIEDRLFFNVAYEQENEQTPVSFNPGSEVFSEFAGTESFPAGQRLFSGGLTLRLSQSHSLEFTSHFRREDDPVILSGANTPDFGWTQDQPVSVYHLRHRYSSGDVSNDLSLSHHGRQWFTEPLVEAPMRVFPSMIMGPLNDPFPIKQNDNVTKITNHFRYFLGDFYGDHIFRIGGELGYSQLTERWANLANPLTVYGADDPESDPFLANIGIGRNVLEGEVDDLSNTDSAVTENDAWVMSLYAEDEWDVTSRLTLKIGLRWTADIGHLNNDFVMPDDFANRLRESGVPDEYIADRTRSNDLDNFGPRLRFSYDLFGNGRTSLAGGWTRSHDRPAANDVNRERREANWLVHTIIFNNAPFLPDDARPFFPDPTEDADELRELILSGDADLQPNITLLRNNIEHPTTDDFTFGVRHQFSSNITGSLDLVYGQTRHGFGSWNFNPLQAGERMQTSEFGDILLSGDFWERRNRSVLLTVRRDYSDDWMLQFNYALSRVTTEIMRPDSPEPFDFVPAPGDERHRFSINGIYDLPLGFRISGFATIASPTPFNAIDGRDLRQDGDFDTDFLDGQPFNFRASGFENWYRKIDLRLSKSFALPRGEVQFLAEVFNVLNTDNFSDYDIRQRNADGSMRENFGNPITAFEPRRVQFGVRVSF